MVTTPVIETVWVQGRNKLANKTKAKKAIQRQGAFLSLGGWVCSKF